jgi:hypothetical protein
MALQGLEQCQRASAFAAPSGSIQTCIDREQGLDQLFDI